MDSTPPWSPGIRLRNLRMSVGLSLGELADAVSCSFGHLRMMETMDRRPSLDLATRIARALSDAAGREVAVSEFYDSEIRRAELYDAGYITGWNDAKNRRKPRIDVA